MATTTIETRDTSKSLRTRTGLTQEETARRAHCGRTALAACESGGDALLKTIRKIAGVLGVTPGEYVDGIETRRAQLRIGGITRKRNGLR